MNARRTFLAALGSGMLAVPRITGAQQLAKVGWLQLNANGMYADITGRGFLKGLAEAGYVEGRNVAFVKRSAESDLRRLPALAREIVAAGVDVIFAPAKPMADAAWYASRRIPTVIATVTDPVLVEYAVSLARPGKHITGVTTANAELIGKRLQLLAEMVPGLKRVGTFIDEALLASCREEVDLMEEGEQVENKENREDEEAMASQEETEEEDVLFDDRTLLDIFGEVTKEYLTQRVVSAER